MADVEYKNREYILFVSMYLYRERLYFTLFFYAHIF